ncbi:PucR family transcriptional regulator [Evansella sp. AB-P1]|uniref:PucR family transcriptional regulator n=1 Tax=Evansella sp. AB-P1 TaxID=3037653 RepID=UPI00241DE5A5|nr:PucR family transcriptional regulator [Evansella sp. AB-P1]MDG5787907.1 PucR family transcriptional regulator [Evansella sp. AB-P1]
MQITDILELPSFKDATVVAGKNKLTNTVQSINLMDAPDIINFLTNDQLLLTTAYSIKNNTSALMELVNQMAEQGCAGLGLKTKRFIEEIPKEVIKRANELNFPIVELPLNYSLGEMLNEALGCILNERTHELNYALNIHRKFTNIVISGGGFSKIIDSLHAILDYPIILLNNRLDIMAFSNDIDKESFFNIYWYIHETIHQEEISGLKAFHIPYQKRESIYKDFFIFPIHTTNKQKGYIIIFSSCISKETPFTLALEQAANVISFEFMKLKAIEQHSRRLKNEFFTNLVEGSIVSEDEIINRGKEYHLNKQLQYICLTCKLDDTSDFHLDTYPLQSEKKLTNKRERIYELLESLLSIQYDNSILFTKGDLFAILIGFDFYNDNIEKKVLHSIREIQQEILQSTDISISFGISNYIESFLEIPTAFQEAVDALRTGYGENKTNFIKTYHIKELTELFKTIPTLKLKEFYKSSLQELAYPEDKEKEDLVQTLAIYLNNNCQIAETSKMMFIHRNTVIYRIKKCEKILGMDFKGQDDTLRLRIALFIQSLITN